MEDTVVVAEGDTVVDEAVVAVSIYVMCCLIAAIFMSDI